MQNLKVESISQFSVGDFTFRLLPSNISDYEDKIRDALIAVISHLHENQKITASAEILKDIEECKNYNIDGEKFQMKHLFQYNWEKNSKFYNIRQFYKEIRLISDEDFKQALKALKLDSTIEQAIKDWKTLSSSYSLESTYNNVVPKTPIDMVDKMKSWSSCDKGRGTGIYMVEDKTGKTIGGFGFNMFNKEETEIEMNVIVFNENNRKQGLGCYLMNAFFLKKREEIKDFNKIVAEVKVTNNSSNALFTWPDRHCYAKDQSSITKTTDNGLNLYDITTFINKDIDVAYRIAEDSFTRNNQFNNFEQKINPQTISKSLS